MSSTILRTGRPGVGSRMEARSWGQRPIRVAAVATGLLLLASLASTPSDAASARSVSVVVRAVPGAVASAERTVARLGGRIGRALPIIDGFAARVPSGAVGLLRGAASVVSATPDAPLQPTTDAYTGGTYDAVADVGSMYNTTRITGAQAFWNAGYTGSGVGVALIDSGVAPVDGLTAPGKVVNGPDLSFESQASNLRYLDTYGHGTHMAGIIGGVSTNAAASGIFADNPAEFVGMAPGARILSLKVADSHGATDVSQVIAAIDWVVQHRNDNGMNIRVLNLSYGTDSNQGYVADPLAYAAEQAWRAGIVVVAAAGNNGYAKTGSLTDPASDPLVVAVGAADTHASVRTTDDTAASFSASALKNDGTIGKRPVDLIAPGTHVVSLRDPNSFIDQTYASTGGVTPDLFRGSGTSQAAAVVSGAAALILQQHPDYTPDKVKKLLTQTATPVGGQPTVRGAGELNLAGALNAPMPYPGSSAPAGQGNGTLEGSRGSSHLTKNGVTLTGDKDIFGSPFRAAAIASLEEQGKSWSGGVWNGKSWSGSGWSGKSWSGTSWNGVSWSDSDWSGKSWSSTSWSGASWSGKSWSNASWTSNDWRGSNWTENVWSGAYWR
jgi:serine protease AprX